ncbi:hypothetical protein E4191_15500 [Paracoccus liaowanqingii]|uniref:Uncharacterized protein n=1 Tax=Paracoccus liaowanqingii TaxID=2560053 RepID=A0A4P7HQ88_9RHOB|nr:hypothetical protein [Paracoccus liaowanqingii]QBX35933.1 hypothetical protein E4191_15500 [Paracoccus liaowanqingii]
MLRAHFFYFFKGLIIRSGTWSLQFPLVVRLPDCGFWQKTSSVGAATSSAQEVDAQNAWQHRHEDPKAAARLQGNINARSLY